MRGRDGRTRDRERIEIVTGGSQVSASSTLSTGSSFDVTAGYLTGDDDLDALGTGHPWTLFNPRGRRRDCPTQFYSASFSSPFSTSAPDTVDRLLFVADLNKIALVLRGGKGYGDASFNRCMYDPGKYANTWRVSVA